MAKTLPGLGKTGGRRKILWIWAFRLAAIIFAATLWQPAYSQRSETTHPDANADENSYALLVGVTHYPALKSFDLAGPANDVLLMKDLLISKFAFAPNHIETLSEAEGRTDPARLPTRKNMQQACRRLVERASTHSRVVVFLAGHGSRQPVQSGTADSEPDGLEKIFLPRDTAGWRTESARVENAIRGRELGDWLRPLQERKVRLWIIIDSCHSGSMIRGKTETPRLIPPGPGGLNIPDEAMARAVQRANANSASPTRGVSRPASSSLVRLGQMEHAAIFYACQSNELTVEKLYPPGAMEQQSCGLLTYTLCRALHGASVSHITYRELVQKIHRNYLAEGRRTPTPLVEGDGWDELVLGSKKLRRPPMVLTEKNRKLTVNAGSLHGLTIGSILAVYGPPGSTDAVRRLGYVRVQSISATRADVIPCKSDGVSATTIKELADGRCEMAELDYGDFQLRVNMSEATESPANEAQRRELAQALEQIAEAPGSPIRLVNPKEETDWMLRLQHDQVHFLPGAEVVREKGRTMTNPAAAPIAPLPLNQQTPLELRARFEHIARAQNLLRLLVRTTDRMDEDSAPKVKIDLFQIGNGADKKGRLLQGPTIDAYAGDRLRIQITNSGKVSVDVTLLYIDSSYGIEPLFPINEINRLNPGEKLSIHPDPFNDLSTGQEFLVLLAVKGEGEPVDFTCLAQPTLIQAKAIEQKRGVENRRGLASPLGRLLRNALYRDGETRGFNRREVEDYTFEVIPINVRSGQRPR